ncbi:MAG: hypothetical protein BWX71_02398 [Deltaproteobacteria bacterium ADurb.Bin072]|nr:MAG: hypothetical protein BWX71_02398 [Deltaproteobacteria bacterium ADurb.Bin072]
MFCSLNSTDPLLLLMSSKLRNCLMTSALLNFFPLSSLFSMVKYA